MTEEELKLAYRVTCAAEKIAESFAIIALAMGVNAAAHDPEAAPAPDTPKKRGRPPGKAKTIEVTEAQLDAVVAELAAATPEEKAAVTAPLVVEPSDAERAAKTRALKGAVLQCITLHGEDEARRRLIYPMVSAVPYAEADAIIKALGV